MIPFTHQTDGAVFLASRDKALLGDTPGLGKTLTAILALQHKGAKKPLIICPAIAKSHWYRTLREAAPNMSAFVYSFEAITAGGMEMMAQLVHAFGCDALVVDEFFKGKHVTSQRANLVFGNDGYARRIRHVLALSGSIPKHPGELYTTLVSLFPMEMLDRGLDTREKFMDKFTVRRYSYVRGNRIEKVVSQQNIATLQQLLGEVMIKRGLEDVGFDVPKVWWQTIRVDADTSGETPIPGHLMAAIQAGELESVANDPHIARMRRRLGELKAPAVVEMLREQLEGTEEKVVVFAHHHSVLEMLVDGLADYSPMLIDGNTPQRWRDLAEESFQKGDARVFIGQNIACQYSLTLTAGHRVILVEPDWNADVNYQLGQRIARIGSNAERCIGQMIALAGTLDEAIIRQNEREVRMATELFAKEATMVE